LSGKILIILLAMYVSGCSTIQKTGRTSVNEPTVSSTAIKNPEEENLCSNNFTIKKAEIEIYSNGENQKLIAFLKYRTPGKYLMSIRNKAGIEAARVYLTKDTVIINDRINKKLYTGSSKYLAEKYGVTGNALPVIVGDFIIDRDSTNIDVKCKNGTKNLVGRIDGKKIEYTVNCRLNKPVHTKIFNDNGNQGLIMNYSDFKKTENKIAAERIIIEDFNKETLITIEIKKIDFKDQEPIVFIPGKKYEKVILQ
jgi:hypothetical protein